MGRILSGQRSTFSGYLTSGILSGRRSTFSGYLTSEILSDRRPTLSGCLTTAILSGRHPLYPSVSQPQFYPADIPLSPDISQPQLYPTDVPPSPDISHLAPDAGWERKAIQLPGQTCPDPLIALTRRASAADNSDSPDSLAHQTLAIRRIHFRPQSKGKLR